MPIRLEIAQSAVNAIQRTGIPPEWVFEAVQAPDDVQKILPGDGDQRDWPVISLYVKRFVEGGKATLLLVQALKQGGTVTASAVWQICPEILGVDESFSAIDIFKAFLDKYGIMLRTACGLTKLVIYQVVGSSTIRKHGKWEQTFNLPEGVLTAEDRRVTQTPEMCLSKLAKPFNVKMHVALFYRINLSNYFYDLSRVSISGP